MKRLAIFLVAFTLRAATYYVGTTGSDSNTPAQAQSSDTPWLTIQHSVNNMACGDTLIVIANGSYVQGADANFPYFPSCVATTTIQSSALDMFAPVGYRTNPPADSPNYGKLQFNFQGWLFQNEVHGGWFVNANNITQGTSPACGFSTIAPMNGSGPTTFTIGACYGGLENLANGSQIELEVNGYNFITATTLPAPLKPYQYYYVLNCSTTPACNAGAGSNFQLATTPGGTPIQVASCAAPNCLVAAVAVAQPLQVDVGFSRFTIPDSFVPCGSGGLNTCFQNGTPVTFSSVGLFNFNPVLPAPLLSNTIYFVINLSGRSFQVSAAPDGPPIALTAIGTGPLSVATVASPSQWAFRGLEFYYTGVNTIYGLLSLGSGAENSTLSMVNHMEVDRCWMHDNPSDNFGVYRSIQEQGQYIYIHDSYLSGNRAGESQAILGTQALGPTVIRNNFLEASGENTLYGGGFSTTGLPNANHAFIGNYYYKPPSWKRTTSTGAASGACWYDATDPNWAGGEWYQDTNASQWYQCNSSGNWAAVGSGPAFNNPTVKDMAEHKSGRYFTYSGNLFNYVWAQAQQGEFFNNSQEPGSGAGIANDHITIQNNKMLHGYQFFEIDQYCFAIPAQPCPTPPSNHVYRHNLMVTDLNACGVLFSTGASTCGYKMYLTSWSGLNSFTYDHNTVWTGDTWSTLTSNGNPPVGAYVGGNPGCVPTFLTDQLVFQNSIFSGDWTGDCAGGTPAIIPAMFTNSTWKNSLFLNGTSGAAGYSSPGATNTFTGVQFPILNSTIGYVNPSAGDYHLASNSRYSAANTAATLLSNDGTDLGADIDLVNMATSGAAAGMPPWDEQAGLKVDVGSSQVVFRYTAPTSDACTATIYRAPARVPANQVATGSDNSANSISNANARELYISGLQPSTLYSYKLACGGGVLLVGSAWTLRSGQGTVSFTFDWSVPTPMQYSSAPSMSNSVSLPAANRQIVPVAANSVVYVQTGTSGPITMVIAP